MKANEQIAGLLQIFKICSECIYWKRLLQQMIFIVNLIFLRIALIVIVFGNPAENCIRKVKVSSVHQGYVYLVL